jgi:cell wall-associated NlpC family hydrolase
MITMLVTTVLVTGAALSGGYSEGVPRLRVSRCAQVRWLSGPDAHAGLRTLTPARLLTTPSSQWAQASTPWSPSASPWSDAALRRWLSTLPATLPDKVLAQWREILSPQRSEGTPRCKGLRPSGDDSTGLSGSLPWTPRLQIDPHGTPGARMWTWHVPGFDTGTTGDQEGDEALRRIHQPAALPDIRRSPSSIEHHPEHEETRGRRVVQNDAARSHRAPLSKTKAAPSVATGRAGAESFKPLGGRSNGSVSRSHEAMSGTVAAAAAVRQIGTPYVWGGGSGAGATGGGFDCSGLALYAWARAGVSLPHYTGSQFTKGTKIPFSQLRPGDLVFFGGGTGDPTHVGIYLKDGTMVHAPKTGDVVRKVDFAHSTYYRARYRGAIRPGR